VVTAHNERKTPNDKLKGTSRDRSLILFTRLRLGFRPAVRLGPASQARQPHPGHSTARPLGGSAPHTQPRLTKTAPPPSPHSSFTQPLTHAGSNPVSRVPPGSRRVTPIARSCPPHGAPPDQHPAPTNRTPAYCFPAPRAPALQVIPFTCSRAITGQLAPICAPFMQRQRHQAPSSRKQRLRPASLSIEKFSAQVYAARHTASAYPWLPAPEWEGVWLIHGAPPKISKNLLAVNAGIHARQRFTAP